MTLAVGDAPVQASLARAAGLAAPPGAHRVFQTMDGLRGVAALFVVSTHAADWFKHIRPGSSYLAVDLFFVLSGFVIGLSYERRLTTTLSTRGFMRIRLVRLYPLYLLGTLITVGCAGLAWLLQTGAVDLGAASTLLLALLMMPAVFGPGSGVLYPLNLPAWSLLSELLVNLGYAHWVARLTTRTLLAMVVLSGCGLIAVGLSYGSLEIGFQRDTFLPSLLRTLYSFLAGLALFRCWRSGLIPVSVSPWLVMAGLMVVLTVPAPHWCRPYYDLCCALVIFPVLVALAANREPPAWSRGGFGLLGLISYPVYMIHVPLYDAIKRLVPMVPVSISIPAPLSGLLFLAVVAGLGVAANGLYDRPVRRLLSQ